MPRSCIPKPSTSTRKSMDLQLQGHVAVIVGGAAGIGLAIAKEFLAEGAAVAILDRDPNTPQIAKSAAGNGALAIGLAADVTSFDGLKKAADEVSRQLGQCRHLVYAAGAGSGKFGFPFWNLTPADWPRILEINLTGAVNTAHAFQPELAKSNDGSVLFISSIAGQIGSQTDPPYSAAKAGLINFAQCAAKDFAPLGVRVNTICPGMVKTALNQSVYEAWASQQPAEKRQSYEEWAEEKIRKVVPLGRWQSPEDIAALAVFLASPRARNMTGQTINVDGGFVMHW
jgi:NAD(P)-dependent dehydrogenase (short-subunit alcohol dehydrogenase family)